MQPQRGQVLAHGVVEEPGNHVALEVLGLEGAQHGVAQFLFGGAQSGDFAGLPGSEANLPAQADGKHGEGPDGAAAALAQHHGFAFRARAQRSRHTPAISGGKASAAERPTSSEAGFPKREEGSP